ncbi:MAG TPA: alpha/beta hydrolase [Nocardioidaceae bacterium]|nr:alpha/beta hydrolase [Nocardioidaceae bacterium]
MRTHDGLELNVRVDGPADAAATVVFSHGWTEDNEFWRYQVRDLRAHFGHDIRLVNYDMRGHGLSQESTLEGATIANLARDLSDIIDTFAPAGDLVLVGHSMGGMTMMELCDHRPDLFTERVVGVLFVATSAGDLVNITLGLPRTGKRLKAQIARGLELRAKMLSRKRRLRAPVVESLFARRFLFGDTYRMRDHMLIVESLINCPPTTMRGFFDDMMLHERHDHVGVLADIPTRILAGEKDLLTPVSHARRLAAEIPGSRLIISPGCGHMIALERDEHVSEQLVEMIRPVLERAQATRVVSATAPVIAIAK